MRTQITPYNLAPINQDMSAARLQALISDWLVDFEQKVQAREKSLDTMRGYERGARKFFTWLEDQQPSPDIIRAWKAEQLQAGNKPAFVNVQLAGIKSFFAWLAEKEQIPFNPAAKVEGAKRKGTRTRHARQPLTDNEARRLLTQPDRSTKQGARDYAILATMLFTAARPIEIHRADLADLATQDGKLVLSVQGKGHTEKDEIVILIGQAENAMRDWVALRGTKPGPLFTSLSNKSQGKRLSRSALREIVKAHYKTAGIFDENKTTHSLRHTAISNAIRRGAPPQKVRGMSRHVSLDTLMIYYHEIDRLEDPAEKYIDYGE